LWVSVVAQPLPVSPRIGLLRGRERNDAAALRESFGKTGDVRQDFAVSGDEGLQVPQ
jgi:hypothetical protein